MLIFQQAYSSMAKVRMSVKAALSLAVVVMATARTTVDGLSSSSSLSSSSPIPPPPPISVPVWSFATATTASTTMPEQRKTSMNIMTFCTPVSVSSPKLWALSFYHGTMTKEAFLDDRSGDDDAPSTGILQLLTHDHRYLVPILGKQSGKDVDKSAACRDEGFAWWTCPPETTAGSMGATKAETETKAVEDDRTNGNHGFEVLPGCALYLRVEWSPSSNPLVDAGDHVVAICKVTRTGVWKPGREYDDDDDDETEGSIHWLDEVRESDTTPLPPGAIDESNALYSSRLRQEGIL